VQVDVGVWWDLCAQAFEGERLDGGVEFERVEQWGKDEAGVWRGYGVGGGDVRQECASLAENGHVSGHEWVMG